MARHAGYVTVKAGMPALCGQPEKLPWTAIPAASAVSRGRGRRAGRTVRAVLVPAWTGFAGAAQVAQVRRTVTRKGVPHYRLPAAASPVPPSWRPGSAATRRWEAGLPGSAT
jgi:hypothetical protein